MQNIFHTLPVSEWSPASAKGRGEIRDLLEEGRVPFFPDLDFAFRPEEAKLLTDKLSNGKSKNISLRPSGSKVHGTDCSAEDQALLHGLLSRYAQHSCQLIAAVAPQYMPHFIPGGTSFRPVGIEGRKTSWRKDDTRLHVDSFPSNPTRGRRLLRVFTNVNPHGIPRVWRVGEPFADFAIKFRHRLRKPSANWLKLLHALHITKSRRSLYDHFMLQLHDHVKADAHYQHTAPQQSFSFPAGSSWLVFSDQVLHAAMSGQFLLEQTFYLPPEAVENRAHSPLHVLEGMYGRKLI